MAKQKKMFTTSLNHVKWRRMIKVYIKCITLLSTARNSKKTQQWSRNKYTYWKGYNTWMSCPFMKSTWGGKNEVSAFGTNRYKKQQLLWTLYNSECCCWMSVCNFIKFKIDDGLVTGATCTVKKNSTYEVVSNRFKC